MRILIACLFVVCSLQALNAQNVGVGTTTPQEKLHVAGNIKADTMKPAAIKFPPNAGAGKILTSDGAGNASWQMNSNSSSEAGYGSWGDCSAFPNISGYQPVSDTGYNNITDKMGLDVSISGDFAIVGLPFDNVDGNPSQGAANIYQYNGSKWVFKQKITDPDNYTLATFGKSVSISGNFAIAYANESGGQSSICVFQYDGTNWVFLQKITDPFSTTGVSFGLRVSISGNFLIAGATGDNINGANQGSAFIFQYDGTAWVFMQRLYDVFGSANDFFGFSVSVSGDVAIVGAFLDDLNITDEGTAHIYRYNGSIWVGQGQITDPEAGNSYQFGYSVSISNNFAIVGSAEAKTGGVAYGWANIFRFNGTNWVHSKKINPSVSASAYLGNSVFISDDLAIIGAPGAMIGGTAEGIAYIYYNVGSTWHHLQVIRDPIGELLGNFGVCVTIDAATRRFLVGSPGVEFDTGKAVFGKVK